jgi:methyl-accepting chemotaxis protein
MAGAAAQIAAEAEEQAFELGEVNSPVNQMAQVHQHNAAMVEKAIAAIHCLREETNALAANMDTFRIGDEPISTEMSHGGNLVKTQHSISARAGRRPFAAVADGARRPKAPTPPGRSSK